MDLLIVDKVPAGQYRGVDRPILTYVGALGSVFLDEAMERYIEEMGQDDAVHDLARARALVEACRHLDPPRDLEIVEATKGGAPETTRNRFLGFDVANGLYGSSAIGVLRVRVRLPTNLPADDPYWLTIPLLRLVKIHFVPRLNSSLLFDDLDTARLCCECLLALMKIDPTGFEQEAYQVIGVWEVLEEEQKPEPSVPV